MPRIKKVFRDSSDVAKLFAAQSQESACAVYQTRCSNGCNAFGASDYCKREGRKHDSERRESCYFHGKTMFSYGSHYLLAKIGLKLNGVEFAVVNHSNYSKQTTGQSYEVTRALKAKGHRVLEIRSDSSYISKYCSEIRDNTPDSVLVKLALEFLERESERLNSLSMSMTVKPIGSFWVTEFKKDAAELNSLLSRFKLNHLKIKVCNARLAKARSLSQAQQRAKRDHETREQWALPIESKGYYNWKEQRQVQRRTA